ncbi:hypothetical protein V7O62_03360 [Methanolobus sp. ZRKC2]|uniref:helix-turn-helix transcriptional regulator n=1 Tax=Methanolobus sp. ZRKC2 TaxID=3125783 RepID=UPI0032542A73
MSNEKTKLIISAGILILTVVIVTSTLLQDAPVVIQVEGESFKIIEIPYSYTTGEAYLLLICGFFSGFACYHVFTDLKIRPFTKERVLPIEEKTIITPQTPDTCEQKAESISTSPGMKEVLLMALEGDERKVVQTIIENSGYILQNELVNRLDFSKAKTSRILSNLEKKRIISKQKYGLTNCISLTEKIRGENK